MNEPIMRRGLSPEGRMIRQRHQGSLLNDEFGVTSQPIHKKIEKDFLKENVLRLKQIQAKCRGQESRPISGCQPVKAIRPTESLLSYREQVNNNGIISQDRNCKLNLREGSAHSDYFSLSDEAQNDSAHNPYHSAVSNKTEVCLPLESVFSKEPTSLVSLDKLYGNLKTPIENSIKQTPRYSSRSSLCNNFQGEAETTSKNGNSPPKFNDFYPHSSLLRRCKIGNMIEKIKSKQPACETNAELIWRDIKKEHKTFFLNDDCISVNTPRTCNLISQNNVVYTNSQESSLQNKRATVARSHSLDRHTYNKTRSLQSQIHNSTYTIDPCSKLINLEHNLQDKKPLSTAQSGQIERENCIDHAESLPNLADSNDEISCNERINIDYLKQQLPSASSSVINNSLCKIRDVPHAKSEDLELDRGRPNSAETNGSNELASIKDKMCIPKETDGSDAFERLNTPIITRKNLSNRNIKSAGQLKQGTLLVKSKSSNNLHFAGEPPPTYKRGQLPKYLKTRKAETERRLEAAAAVDPMCPPGHSPLPDPERRNTLHLLKKAQVDVMQQLSSLPLAQDTLRLRKHKRDLEVKLTQIEDGIEIFSLPKVYVLNDE